MYAPRTTADVTIDSWEDFQANLAETILDLADGSFVIIHVPSLRPKAPEPEVTHGVLKRIVRAVLGRGGRERDPFLQYDRLGRHVICEVGGPVDLGGPVRLSLEQQAQIVTIGWAEPTPDRDKQGWGNPSYRAYFPHDGVPARIHGAKIEGEYRDLVDAEHAARMAIETLRGPLGAESPRRLRVERSG